jgi:hypothetical protein
MSVYSRIASLLVAIANCEKSGNAEWRLKHKDTIEGLVREHMPSGSGFDAGTTLDFGNSSANKLVFVTAFHHMNDQGGYCGWSYHGVIVTPTFSGVNVRVTGRDKRDIKSYICEVFASIEG